MDIYAAIKGAEGATESGLGQFLACHDHSSPAQQEFEHVEFSAGQLDGNTIAKRGAGLQRESDVADGQGFVAGAVVVDFERATEHGADAGYEFTGIEGLGNVVISADFKTQNSIDGFPTSGEQDHRYARVEAQSLEQLESRASGKHHVENDDVVFTGERSVKAGAVVEDGVNLESLVLQKALQQRDQALIVIHDEYSAHVIHSAREPGGWL